MDSQHILFSGRSKNDHHTSLHSSRDIILRRWEQSQRELRWDLSSDKYITTVRSCCDKSQYEDEFEPTVSADPYDIGKARLTVNAYNALILNTPNLFIADIDEGDPRLSKYATVAGEDEVLENLKALGQFDAENDTDLRSASWRVYRTHSGFRVICTSRVFDDLWFGERVLRFLRADPRYIDLCQRQKCYRARLTPKPWRDRGDAHCVCYLIDLIGDKIAPEVEDQIRLHDQITLPQHDYCTLA